MQGIFHALTQDKPIGFLYHGGFLWKCASLALEDGTPTNHIVAALSGNADTIYAVGNHSVSAEDEAAHDDAVMIPGDQPQFSPANLICFCGQPLLKE